MATLEAIRRQLSDISEISESSLGGMVVNQTRLSSLLVDLDELQWDQYQKSSNNIALNDIEQVIRDRLFKIEYMLMQEQEREKEEEHIAQGEETIYHEEENIESLRKRLLASNNNEFDSVRSENDYHDSMQSDLIDSLPMMVTAIKSQALQFQEMIQNDANILKDVTNKFEMSHGKFNTVNDALSKYHKEGRLGIWFYIRVIVSIFLMFLTLLVLIRLIPAR